MAGSWRRGRRTRRAAQVGPPTRSGPTGQPVGPSDERLASLARRNAELRGITTYEDDPFVAQHLGNARAVLRRAFWSSAEVPAARAAVAERQRDAELRAARAAAVDQLSDELLAATEAVGTPSKHRAAIRAADRNRAAAADSAAADSAVRGAIAAQPEAEQRLFAELVPVAERAAGTVLAYLRLLNAERLDLGRRALTIPTDLVDQLVTAAVRQPDLRDTDTTGSTA